MTHFSGQCKTGRRVLHKMAGDRLKVRRGCGEGEMERGERREHIPSPRSTTPPPPPPPRGPARFTAPVDGPCDWAGALSVRFSRRALLQGSPINNRSHWPSLTFPATSWPALGLRSSSPTFTEYPTPHRSHPRPFVAWPAQHIRQSLCRVSASREGPASLPTT
jgi:hypothetical protein